MKSSRAMNAYRVALAVVGVVALAIIGVSVWTNTNVEETNGCGTLPPALALAPQKSRRYTARCMALQPRRALHVRAGAAPHRSRRGFG